MSRRKRKLNWEEDQTLPADTAQDSGDSSAQWLTSYADVITLLLCFFIIFFTANRNEEKNVIESIIMAFSTDATAGEAGKGAGDGGGAESDANTGNKPGIGGSGVTQDRPDLYSALAHLKNLKVTKSEDDLYVEFDKGSFFGAGSTSLTGWGKTQVDAFSQVMGKYQDKIYLDVQGHSDKTPVSKGTKKRYRSNIELSALRALTVYNVIKDKGFSEDSLSISGYSSHRSKEKLVSSKEEKLKYTVGHDRRITFRIMKR